MLNLHGVPNNVIHDICKNLGWDGESDDKQYLIEISQMSAKEAFSRWLSWHGLHGWQNDIIEALDSLRAAEQEQP